MWKTASMVPGYQKLFDESAKLVLFANKARGVLASRISAAEQADTTSYAIPTLHPAHSRRQQLKTLNSSTSQLAGKIGANFDDNVPEVTLPSEEQPAFVAELRIQLDNCARAIAEPISNTELREAGIAPDAVESVQFCVHDLGRVFAAIGESLAANDAEAEEFWRLKVASFSASRLAQELLAKRVPVIANNLSQMLTAGCYGRQLVRDESRLSGEALAELQEARQALCSIAGVDLPVWQVPKAADLSTQEVAYRAGASALTPLTVGATAMYAAETRDLLPYQSEDGVAALQLVSEKCLTALPALALVGRNASGLLGERIQPYDLSEGVPNLDAEMRKYAATHLALTNQQAQAPWGSSRTTWPSSGGADSVRNSNPRPR